MTEEIIIPNDGRAIDINSPTAKSIIEGVVPKAVRTWTIFKNTNNTLEGIEAFPFAMWQVALDEIEKESDNVVFMSDDTVKLIMNTLERLEQENKELKEKKDKYYQQTLDDEILMNELSLEVDLRKKESDFYLEKLSKYRSALEEIREIVNEPCIEDEDCETCDSNCMCKEIINKINEVLQCE